MFIRFKYAILSSLILIGLVLYVASKNVPIPKGDAEDFWKFACGVEVKKFDGHFPYAHETGIFRSQDGWYFYYFQEHHGRHVFKVDRQSLLIEQTEVIDLLDQKITTTVQGTKREDYMAENNAKRLACLEIKNELVSLPEQFIDTISLEVANQYDGDSFNAQWVRSKSYWVSIVFEAVFIPFWYLFSFHGGIFGKLNRKGAVRLAFSPLLLFAPHFLGYAPYLFSFGPSGGILYPLFAGLMSLPFGWLPFNQVELYILNFMPQPLSYISQVPYSPMAISFSGSVSPTVLCVYAGVVLAFSKVVSRYRANRKS